MSIGVLIIINGEDHQQVKSIVCPLCKAGIGPALLAPFLCINLSPFQNWGQFASFQLNNW